MKQCKAHKPTKNYPFRILVSTIGTAPYKVSKYLAKIRPNKIDEEIIGQFSKPRRGTRGLNFIYYEKG
jgi:hypothetical protein